MQNISTVIVSKYGKDAAPVERYVQIHHGGKGGVRTCGEAFFPI